MRIKVLPAPIVMVLLLMRGIGAYTQIPTIEKSILPKLRLCSFNINSGATETNSRTVTLNCDTSTTSATEYLASERQDFVDAYWKQLQSAIPFTLTSAYDGQKTVYFKLRNTARTETGVVSKSILLKTRKDFVFNSRDAQIFANTQGFSFSAIQGDATSDCLITGEQTVNIDAIAAGKLIMGAKCDFILFGGRNLKNGWMVKSYEANGSYCLPPDRGYTLNERPAAGASKLTFRIHSWAGSMKSCQFIIGKITLEGPVTSTDWKDAFR